MVLACGDGLGVLCTADSEDGGEERGSEGCKKEGAGKAHERDKRAAYGWGKQMRFFLYMHRAEFRSVHIAKMGNKTAVYVRRVGRRRQPRASAFSISRGHRKSRMNSGNGAEAAGEGRSIFCRWLMIRHVRQKSCGVNFSRR